MSRYLTCHTAQQDGKFYWEHPSDPDNVVTVFFNEAGGLSVAVSNEQAIGSYNESIECHAFLDQDDAARLRDYIIYI